MLLPALVVVLSCHLFRKDVQSCSGSKILEYGKPGFWSRNLVFFNNPKKRRFWIQGVYIFVYLSKKLHIWISSHHEYIYIHLSLSYSLFHSFILSSFHSFILSFVPSFLLSFFHSFVLSFIPSFFLSFFSFLSFFLSSFIPLSLCIGVCKTCKIISLSQLNFFQN